MALPVPPDPELIELLDKFAPFRTPDLVPEVKVFYARSLIEIWAEAEKLAGGVLPSPFWAYPWAAGVALARVILDTPDLVGGKRVLDFGCGGGIASLAAARAGAGEVIANDVDPWALAVLRLAAQRQGLIVTPLLGDLTDDAILPGAEVVICSDLAYEKAHADPQRRLLDQARASGALVLVADAGRTYFRDDGMEVIAQFEIAVPRDLEGVSRRTAIVFRMT